MNAFEKLLADLVKSGTQFVTIGGIACAFNGLVRSTEDVDILIESGLQNVETFLRFIKSFSPLAFDELTVSDFKDEEGAVRIMEDFPLDVFVRASGHNFEDLSKYILYYNLDELKIPYLNKEGLILLKSNSFREIDQRDVFQLKNLDS